MATTSSWLQMWRVVQATVVGAMVIGSSGCPDDDDFSAEQVQGIAGALAAAPAALAEGIEAVMTEEVPASAFALTTTNHPLTCRSGSGSLKVDYDVTTAPCATGDIYTLAGTASTTFDACERSACDETAKQDGTSSGPFVLTYDACTGSGQFEATHLVTGSGCSDTSTMTARIGDGSRIPVGYDLDITISLPGFAVESVSGHVCTDSGPCAEAGGCAFSSFDDLFAVIDPQDTCTLQSASTSTCRDYYQDPDTVTNPDPDIDAANKDFCLNGEGKQEGNCCVGSTQCSGLVDGTGNPIAGRCCPFEAPASECGGHASCECFPAPVD